MDSYYLLQAPILQPDAETGLVVIREACGLNHERQILAVALPSDFPAETSLFVFRDKCTGVEFPAQRSQQDSRVAFVQVELRAAEELQLAGQAQPPKHHQALTLSAIEKDHSIITNDKWTVELFLGEWKSKPEAAITYKTPVPLRRLRVKEGPWRGNTFFDTRHPLHHVSSVVLESGPLRIVTQFQAHIGSSHTYTAHLTFDAGADFITVEETFNCDAGDQLVWDFSGDDLPEQIHLLDSSAGFTSQSLHYFYDRRLARLACWNQFSQLHDFSDGYALTFPNHDDAIGFVALKGGDWRGNSLNFLEAWTRRWFPADRSSRRLVPPEAKADAAPSPEKVAARPANLCNEHFSVEGWLHHGRRTFALVLTSRDSLRPADWQTAEPLGAFEARPDRERYRQQQSLLRRIHTQHGLLPFTDLASLCWSWPLEIAPAKTTTPPWIDSDRPESDQSHSNSIPERIEQMLEFLAARVFGFWEGSASAYTNPVVSRRLAHDLADWEWLVAHGHLTAEQIRQSRAWFIFLIQLFYSDHYYPGPAAMNMGEPSQRLEPTMAGMANQNFFTDTFNMPGMAAQVFHAHPDASSWRDRFTRMWRRQLEYHVYPESGVWEESHTYLHHVLQTVIPTLERRRDDGVEDSFAHPPFHRLARFLLKTLSPRDAAYEGKRHVVALGDHGVDLKDLYRPLYRTLAHNIAPSNPSLAAQLAWAYREMDGTLPLIITPTAPPWQNEYVQGLGYFFRATDARGESLFVLRSGNSWGHHHNDEGSVQFFCAGRSWIVDSAFSYPQKDGPRKIHVEGHSRWTPRDFEPLTYLWQFNRGWISHHQDDAPFPCAVAFTPVYMAESAAQQYLPLRRPILHWRAVVQLTPSAFLILDRSDIALSQLMRFHVPLNAPFILGDVPAQEISLRLLPLIGLQPPQTPATDHPTKAGELFATQEIRYEMDSHPFSAILIAVENDLAKSLFHLSRNDGRIAVQHPDFAFELSTSNPEQPTLKDLKSGREQVIPLQSKRI